MGVVPVILLMSELFHIRSRQIIEFRKCINYTACVKRGFIFSLCNPLARIDTAQTPPTPPLLPTILLSFCVHIVRLGRHANDCKGSWCATVAKMSWYRCLNSHWTVALLNPSFPKIDPILHLKTQIHIALLLLMHDLKDHGFGSWGSFCTTSPSGSVGTTSRLYYVCSSTSCSSKVQFIYFMFHHVKWFIFSPASFLIHCRISYDWLNYFQF